MWYEVRIIGDGEGVTRDNADRLMQDFSGHPCYFDMRKLDIIVSIGVEQESQSMPENVVLHVRLGERRTTITMHPTLVRLGELALDGKRSDLERWLSAELTRRYGEIPRSRTVRPGIGRYAVDIILSMVARPDLWAAWEDEFLARH